MSALMEAMAAAGAPMEAIVIAVRALEAKDAELKAAEREAADKRAAHAAWKKARRAELAVSMDSPRTTDGQSTPIPAPSPSSSPDPSNNPTPTPGETPRARKGTRLSDDWRPTTLNPETVAGEVVRRRGQEWARRALESFRNHWRSANGPTATKRDWQAAWANWIIEQDNRDERRIQPRNPTHAVAGNDGLGPTARAALRVIGGG